MIRESVLLTAKSVAIVCHKNHFESKCRSSWDSNSDRPRGSKSFGKCGKCGHKKVDYVEYSEESDSSESDSESKGIKDLTEQVQSLFYH